MATTSTMVRLSAAIRDSIVDALLKSKFVKEDLELDGLKEKEEEAEREAERLAYDAAFSKKTQEFMNSAAEGMFPTAKKVMIRIEHSEGNYVDKEAYFGEERRVPWRHSTYGSGGFAAVLPPDHPYVKAVENLKAINRERTAKRDELRERKHASRRKVLTVIESVTTVKRLTEVWPEVAEFLPESVSGRDGGVPATMIADLNAEFGLSNGTA